MKTEVTEQTAKTDPIVNFRYPERERDRLHALCKRLKRTPSDFIRQAVRDAVKLATSKRK